MFCLHKILTCHGSWLTNFTSMDLYCISTLLETVSLFIVIKGAWVRVGQREQNTLL